MLNQVNPIGNIGKGGCILTATHSGKEVANCSIATTFRYRGKDHERHEKTEWHSLVFWGPRALNAARLLTEGRLVHIKGRLQTRSREEPGGGSKRFKTEIICDSFLLLGPNRQESADGEHPVAHAPEDAADGAAEPEDDEIPF